MQRDQFVKTKSGNEPWDVAVTRSGGLVYIDDKDRSITLVKGTQNEIQTLITLQSKYLPICVVCPLKTWLSCPDK